MSWNSDWTTIIFVLLLSGAPVTVVVWAIMVWRRRYHSHHTPHAKEGKGRSHWRG